MGVEHKEVEFFFALFVVDGGEKHTAGVNAHHRARREVSYGDAGLTDELFGLVEGVDTGKDSSVFAGAVVEGEFQEFFRLGDGFAREDFYGAEVGFREGLEIDVIFEKRLDFDVAIYINISRNCFQVFI